MQCVRAMISALAGTYSEASVSDREETDVNTGIVVPSMISDLGWQVGLMDNRLHARSLF